MTSVFVPGVEDGSNENGEILYDADTLQHIDSFEDPCYDKLVKQSDICDFGDQGFLLHNLMSSKECQHYIETGEISGFRELRTSQRSYRDCQRIIFESSGLASVLWERIKDFLKDITVEGDPSKQHIHGVKCLVQGTWEPHRLNKVFRLCRYYPGGHFAPHFDGHFVESATVRSMKTLMLYLNGDFNGGSTNFVDESQTLYKDADGKFCAEEKNILYRIQPETGMGILFNHQRLHEGQKLSDGVKYILRTDIMFKNTSKPSLSPDEEKGLQMIQEAERKEAAGECLEAMELYRKAYKLCPTLESESYGN
ncbi:uncharacterized protein LOC121372442 [Gigantopelta aegis]|uniref:uncharacterized protein LOC121372442 n=1 Tax=Gigantopelta aegis TaxID=1735272 RepID=UPI001B88B4A5|nr:uncharacterized protein LOC121372442 [Gigantopelta aegis]